MSRPMRVAIVAPTLGILGGQSVQAHELVDRWRGDPEVEAWLVAMNPAPPRVLAPLHRIKYARTAVTQAIYWPLLWRELRPADVVHVFSAAYTSFLLSPLPAMCVAGGLNRPVLLNYHSGEAHDHLTRSRVARRALSKVPHRVVPSPYLAKVFAAFGLEAEVIPNVIDHARFRFRTREPLRPRFLSTRNLEPMYDVACTLRAFRRIQDRVPEATLTVVGQGREAAQLRDLAGSLGLRSVRFIGAVNPVDMPRHYAEADIYLQSPRIDNMPLSVLEAFASGLPVVSTEAGGVPAMMTAGEHGLLVEVGDDGGLASAALRLLGDPAMAQRLAARAFESTAAYGWDRLRARWLSVYRRLAARPVAAAASLEHT